MSKGDDSGMLEGFLKLYREIKPEWPDATYVAAALLTAVAGVTAYRLAGGWQAMLLGTLGMLILLVLIRVLFPRPNETQSWLVRFLRSMFETMAVLGVITVIAGALYWAYTHYIQQIKLATGPTPESIKVIPSNPGSDHTPPVSGKSPIPGPRRPSGSIASKGVPQSPSSTVDLPAPSDRIFSGGGVYCALVGGDAYCWGTRIGRPNPSGPRVAISLDGDFHDPGSDPRPKKVTFFYPYTVASISVSSKHACAVLANGNVACWGYNDHGRVNREVEPSATEVPTAVRLAEPATQVSVGYDHSCALAVGGKVYCWGSNELGQTGSGDADAEVHKPTAVKISVPVNSISSFVDQTCALSPSKDLLCWGRTLSGNAFTPKQMFEGFKFREVSVGPDGSFCGITLQGKTFCATRSKTGYISTSELRRIRVSRYRSGIGACGLDEDGSAECWDPMKGHVVALGGKYVDVAPGETIYALDTTANVDTWDSADVYEKAEAGNRHHVNGRPPWVKEN
jgi:hypothetical protein